MVAHPDFLKPLVYLHGWYRPPHKWISTFTHIDQLTTKMTKVLNKTLPSIQTIDTITTPIDIKLDGTNYALWSQVFEIYISIKDKMWYINGDLLQPPQMDAIFRRWHTDNTIVKSWLINSMDATLIWMLSQVYLISHSQDGIWRNCYNIFWCQQHLPSVWSTAMHDPPQTSWCLFWKIL